MKVQIKDLKPNPFRDMKNYPINQEKVQSLTNSINETGFWDNILARKNNGNIEIAYGHHRLVVLKKLFKSDDYVDIPVRELDDSTMIRIMANENDENWGTNPTIIDETIKVVRKYLKSQYQIFDIDRRKGTGGKPTKAFKGLPLPEIGKYRTIIAWQMSQWLGGNWSEYRISETLNRLRLHDEGELTKETKKLPSEGAVRKFVKATRQVKTSPEQQKRAVERIIESEDLSESGMKSVLLDEKYRGKEKGKEERDFIEFKNYVMRCTKEINTLNGKLGKLLLLEEELKPDMLLYRGSIEARDFDSALRLLISIIKEFLGKGETECQKQVVSK